MNIKVTTLVENYVKGRDVVAEHGLSMLIEVEDNLLLFDTGASNLFAENAKVLGKRIEDVDYLILSHGHSDHTGGLKTFLDINTNAKIICKSSILIPKYRGERENGICNIYGKVLNRFIFIDELTEVVKGVFVFPNIEIKNNKDTHFSNFELLTDNGRISDLFNDELAIVIENEDKISILSSCSHRGITNIITSVRNYFPTHKFNYLVGGFHLVDSSVEDAILISDFLRNDMPEHIGVCHCTGLDGYAIFRNEFKEKVFYNYCGSELIL